MERDSNQYRTPKDCACAPFPVGQGAALGIRIFNWLVAGIGFQPTTFGLIDRCPVIFFRQRGSGTGDSRILSLACQDLWYTVVPEAGEYHL